jgi:hypothetical protein
MIRALERVDAMDLRRLGLWAIAALLATNARAAEAVFQGDDAVARAGAAITASLGYQYDFDPGRLALQWITAYGGRFIVPVLFSPRLGHQVVLQKDHTVTADNGTRCANVTVTIEHFPDASPAERDAAAQRGPLPVARTDQARYLACHVSPREVRLDQAEVNRDQPAVAGQRAFATPQAVGAGTGSSGF